jgi:hypothetical protein
MVLDFRHDPARPVQLPAHADFGGSLLQLRSSAFAQSTDEIAIDDARYDEVKDVLEQPGSPSIAGTASDTHSNVEKDGGAIQDC